MLILMALADCWQLNSQVWKGRSMCVQTKGKGYTKTKHFTAYLVYICVQVLADVNQLGIAYYGRLTDVIGFDP